MPPGMGGPEIPIEDAMAELDVTSDILTSPPPPEGPSAPSVVSRPGTAAPKSLNPAEFRHYICLYPCYFDPKRKISEGRRVPKSLVASLDKMPVTHADMIEACGSLGFAEMVLEVRGCLRRQCANVERLFAS